MAVGDEMEETQTTQGIMDLGWTQDDEDGEGDEVEKEIKEKDFAEADTEVSTLEPSEKTVENGIPEEVPEEEENDTVNEDEDADDESEEGEDEPPNSPEPDILEKFANQAEEGDEELVIRKRKKKVKKRNPNGLKMTDFQEKDEAEFDEEADIANVSEDEDEKGMDEYEEEEITEKLPSLGKQQKEIAKIHNKLQRDEDQMQLKRMENAFMGDEISQAKAKKRKYKWVLSNEFEGR